MGSLTQPRCDVTVRGNCNLSLTRQHRRTSLLQGGKVNLDVRGETLPEILRNVPCLEVAVVVAESVAIARAECTWRIHVGSRVRRREAPTGGTTTLMVFGEGGIVVHQVGGGRGRHCCVVYRKSSDCSSQVSVEYLEGWLVVAGARCSTSRRCIGICMPWRSEEYCGETEEVSSLGDGIAAQVRIECLGRCGKQEMMPS